MTRAQFVFVCAIGALAMVAYFQSLEVAKAMRRSGITPRQPVPI